MHMYAFWVAMVYRVIDDTIQEFVQGAISSLNLLLPMLPRPQADSLSLRSLDDAKCHVYAFEMAPLSGAESVEGPQPETDNRPVFGPLPRPQAMGYQALGSGEGEGEDSQDSRTVQTASSAAAPQEGSPRDVSGSETPVSGSCAVRQVQGSDSDSDGRPAKVRRKEEKEGGEEGGGAEAMDCSPLQTPAARNEDAPVVSSAGAGSSTGLGTGVGAGPGMGAGPARAVVLEWRSCAICLEELVDSELLTHRPCGAVLCGGCLKASTQHYGSAGGDLIPCPVSTHPPPPPSSLPPPPPPTPSPPHCPPHTPTHLTAPTHTHPTPPTSLPPSTHLTPPPPPTLH